jgi:hypothetical protein
MEKKAESGKQKAGPISDRITGKVQRIKNCPRISQIFTNSAELILTFLLIYGS